MTNCRVCENEIYKYKCPICSIPYCSVTCFKTHKNSECKKTKDSSKTTEPQIVEDRTPQRMIFETVDTVPIEKLEQLKNSEGLKELLQNKHMRDFLQELNDARNPWKAMKVAMTEPLFLEFADECMKILEN